MRWISSGIKVGILMLLFVGGSYIVWKSIGKGPVGEQSMRLGALFKDASGLPVGSRVMVAGLPVGEISNLSIDGRYAKLSFRVRDDVEVWSNAVVFKKSSSLLGAYYLEVDPGGPISLDRAGNQVQNTRLEDGDLVPLVVEATSPDQLFRRIEQSLPQIDRVLVSVEGLSEDLRRVVNGPLASVAGRIDDLVRQEAETVADILARADRIMERVEGISADVRSITGGVDSRVFAILDQLDKASQDARALVGEARLEVAQTGEKVREKLDMVDSFMGSSASVASKLDEDKGTLGRLINDATIADNVEDITEDAKGFIGALANMQTYVGLRTEWNVFAGAARHYVSLELATRPDKFYYIELEQGPRGDYPKVTLEYDPNVNPTQYVRKVLIEDEFRLTFQFAKRIGWATLRFGLKESTGGVGLDIATTWLGRSLRINSDVFDASFDELPRLKVSAAYEVFRHLYVLGGIDEALNPPRTLDIARDGLEVPVQFERLRYGRDVFFGAMLRFNDRDLAALLTVGGSVVSGVIE